MQPRRTGLKGYVSLGTCLAVAIGLSTYYVATLHRTPFFADESHWIGKSAGWFLLVDGRFDEAFWKLEAIDQPLLVPYMFGVVVRLSGYDGSTINGMYDFSKDFETNLREGCVPDDVLLRRCRLVSVACGILGLCAAMAVVWRVAGMSGALAVSLLLGLNPHYIRHVQRAMSEGALALWILLGWLVCAMFAAAMDQGRLRSARRWSILMGVVAGLGLMTKLTGLMIFLCIGAVGLVWAWRLHRAKQARGRGTGWRFPVVSVVVAMAIGYCVFIAQSPTTWGNPLGVLGKMVSWRRGVIAKQQLALREYAVGGACHRVGLVCTRFGHDMGTFAARGISRTARIPWLDGWVFLAGLLWLIAAERRARVTEDLGHYADPVVMLIWSAVLIGSLMLLLGIDNDRYYLPGLIATAVVEATAVGVGVRWLVGKISGRIGASRATA
ncbi:MAG: phospholipid carrier-dependent glycosyltransferase [Phycisphaerae bacterium]|nr:phospholipid carrier-dependent glycosyltransferase [Phycisphaerae bacterium]